MKVRKFLRIIHRDLGYIAFALTIIYSISGIAVNHINDWNPNYIISKDTLVIPSRINSSLSSKELATQLPIIFGIKDSIKSSFRESPNSIEIFFEGKTLTTNLQDKIAVLETVKSRHVFRQMNFLHLNNAKKLWTWIADIFAGSLILLAISGIFMLKGKKGIKGRGKWFILIGILIPLLFLYLYF